MGDGFYGSKHLTNSLEVLKEGYKGKSRKKQTTENTHIHTKWYIIKRDTYQTQQVPSLQYGVIRGRLQQRAESPSLNGSVVCLAQHSSSVLKRQKVFAIECLRRSIQHRVNRCKAKFGKEAVDRCKPNCNAI